MACTRHILQLEYWFSAHVCRKFAPGVIHDEYSLLHKLSDLQKTVAVKAEKFESCPCASNWQIQKKQQWKSIRLYKSTKKDWLHPSVTGRNAGSKKIRELRQRA